MPTNSTSLGAGMQCAERVLLAEVEQLQADKIELIRATSLEIDRLRNIIQNLVDLSANDNGSCRHALMCARGDFDETNPTAKNVPVPTATETKDGPPSLAQRIEQLQNDKMQLIRATSTEIERLRQIIRNLTNSPSKRDDSNALTHGHETPQGLDIKCLPLEIPSIPWSPSSAAIPWSPSYFSTAGRTLTRPWALSLSSQMPWSPSPPAIDSGANSVSSLGSAGSASTDELHFFFGVDAMNPMEMDQAARTQCKQYDSVDFQFMSTDIGLLGDGIQRQRFMTSDLDRFDHSEQVDERAFTIVF